MKIAFCVTLLLFLISADGFITQRQRPRIACAAATTARDLPAEPNLFLAWRSMYSTAVSNEPRAMQPSWMSHSSSSNSQNDGMVTAMAMLKQAKLELSEVSCSSTTMKNEVVYSCDYNDNQFRSHDNTRNDMKTRAEQWERSVFNAMEHIEYQIESSAQATGKRSLQLLQRAFVEPWYRLRNPFSSWDRSPFRDLQTLEQLERTVFRELERLEHMLEQSASNTGAYMVKLIQAIVESIRSMENLPHVRRTKMMYTQKLASMIRDMADRLERQVEQEQRADAVDHPELKKEVWATSMYRTRVRSTPHRRRRRPGIITSFLTRLAWKVSAKWHRA